MARVCQITWKKTSTGHNVSHSNRKTKRRWLPNLIKRNVLDNRLWRTVKMRISTNALRTLTKRLVENADGIYLEMKKKLAAKAK